MTGNIYLTGFMGVGKSTVGGRLSRRIGWNHVDTDRLITEKSGRSHTSLFDDLGEERFRDVESGIIQEICQGYTQTIVSLGGGAILRDQNRSLILGSGTLIYLAATPEKLNERLQPSYERPLLKGLDEQGRIQKISQLLQEREKVYSEANFRIDTDLMSMEDIVRRVVGLLGMEPMK